CFAESYCQARHVVVLSRSELGRRVNYLVSRSGTSGTWAAPHSHLSSSSLSRSSRLLKGGDMIQEDLVEDQKLVKSFEQDLESFKRLSISFERLGKFLGF
ncbi:hypothetical protein GIB67_041633, partial [Kingdonia uniflora]